MDKPAPIDPNLIMEYQRLRQIEQNILAQYSALVWSEVHRCQAQYGKHNDDDDLYQVGCLSLLRAAQTWDPKRKPRFAAYAASVIRRKLRQYKGRIIREVKRQSLYSPSPNSSPSIHDVWKEASIQMTFLQRVVLILRLGIDGGPELSIDQIARHLSEEFSRTEVRLAYRIGLKILREHMSE